MNNEGLNMIKIYLEINYSIDLLFKIITKHMLNRCEYFNQKENK